MTFFFNSRFIRSILLLAVITVTAYSNTFSSPFVFDDLHTLVETEGRSFQKHFQNIANISAIVQVHPLRVITYFSLAVNYHLGELNPFGYHLFNLLFHVLTVLLVFLLVFHLLRLNRQTKIEEQGAKDKMPDSMFRVRCSMFDVEGKNALSVPFLTALVFSLLPIQTEAVTYIISRATVLNAFFFLLALYAFIVACALSCRRLSKRSVLLFLVALVFFPACILSKEIGVIFPVVVIAVDFFFLRRFPLKYRFFFFYFPLIIVSAGFGYHYQGSFKAYVLRPTLQLRSISENLILQGNIMPLIARTLCLPMNLNLDYDFATVSTRVDARFLAICWMVLFSLILCWKIGSPVFFFFVSWTIITLLPTNSFLARSTPLSDHNLYLPSLGFCFILSHGFYWTKKKSRSFWLSPPLALTVCLLFFTLALERNQVYGTTRALWDDATRKSPFKYRPHVNLGNALLVEGKLDEAMFHYEFALRFFPSLPETHNNLGAVLNKKGLLDTAIYHFEQAIALDPRYAEAHKNLGISYGQKGVLDKAVASFQQALNLNPNYAEAHQDLGLALSQMGRDAEAMHHYQKALEIKPSLETAYFNRGALLEKNGDLDGAVQCLSKLLEINPAHAGAHNVLGIIFNKKGLKGEALAHFHEALKRNPASTQTLNNLGIFFLSENKNPEALRYFSRSLEIDPLSPETHFYIGTIYFNQGALELARRHLQEALRLHPDYAEAHFNLGQLLLELGQPLAAESHLATARRLKPEMMETIHNP